MNATRQLRTITADPKVFAEKLNILAVLVAGQGGEARIPLAELGGWERLEFFFDSSTNEHVVRLGPALDTVHVGYAPQLAVDPEVAWRSTMPNAWLCITNRIEGELLAMRPGSDLNIAGWLDTGEHFILCADQGLRGRTFEVQGAGFTVVETEMVQAGDPYRRLSKIIIRRNS
jgi:hypothetical protein